jgi:hypothetical protein
VNPELVKKMPGIVVGVSLAETLKLELGDCVTVTSPTIGFSFSGGSLKPPVAKRFRVVAVFEAGFDQYDSKLVYTDLYEAQSFYDEGDTVTGVEMKVDDIDEARAIAKQIGEMLSGLYHTMDWEELNHGLFTALRIQQIGMSAVLALIIVVAALHGVATLIMVVLDKKKEIAVLKAMGATDEAVLRIFLYQGGDHRRPRDDGSVCCSASSCARACSCTAFPWIRRCISSRTSRAGAAARVPADGGDRHRHLPAATIIPSLPRVVTSPASPSTVLLEEVVSSSSTAP